MNNSVPPEERKPKTVSYEFTDGVAIIRFNRPDRANAFTPQLGNEYLEALERAAVDPNVRAILVTGEGKAFCVGADMEMFQNSSDDVHPDLRPISYPLNIPKPVIAAINGPAAGIGLVMALMCDVRLAAPGIKLTTSFARRGLIAEYGSAWVLPRLIGISKAKDLLLSGRVVMSEEAMDMGLVDRLSEPGQVLTDALAYAYDITEYCSPSSMATIKQQLGDALEQGLASAVKTSEKKMHESFRKPDVSEGFASYLQKRSPEFPGLSWTPDSAA